MQNDIDLQETQEWREAFASLVAQAGPDRARFILDELSSQANGLRLGWRPSAVTPYVNTISVDEQPVFPGDLDLEQQLASLMRWNALAMVVRANRLTGELGGHIASYASAADLFEVGFNHFWRAGRQGDLVFMQA
ncbi:MAG: pyruvate dehydrogenase (acetyl-transferring), homodimeric type, partial [Burkholderiaceae bacterium]